AFGREAGALGEAHRDRGQRERAGDGDVDLAADDQQRHRQRDQRLFAEVLGAVQQVVQVQEVRQGDAVRDEDGDEQHGQQAFPAPEE
ncbi:conserved hypothetical protein, partial [Ricinus communis]